MKYIQEEITKNEMIITAVQEQFKPEVEEIKTSENKIQNRVKQVAEELFHLELVATKLNPRLTTDKHLET